MIRTAAFLLLLLISFATMESLAKGICIMDSLSRRPLPNASVFDSRGNLIGISDRKGRLPGITRTKYPLTVRYMGYDTKTADFSANETDTIFLQENYMQLPEVVVNSREHRMLHLLAYVREYSTLSTYFDTIFMFREKMVDYMLPADNKVKYKGWNYPRILSSQSYYRFTNSLGLDSVSNRCSHHFSWTDWVGIPSSIRIPSSLEKGKLSTDTLRGQYGISEMWIKNDTRLTADINVLADTTARKWVPGLSSFFRDHIDYERFRLTFNYDMPSGASLTPVDCRGYSFNIESNGRGRGMFMFNRKDEPFYVTTYAEVYVIDKEYITVKEAKKWSKADFGENHVEIIRPPEAEALQPAIAQLVARVENLDHNSVRTSFTPDHRLMGRFIKRNFGQGLLQRLKDSIGLGNILGNRKQKKNWRKFSQDQIKRNARQKGHR